MLRQRLAIAAATPNLIPMPVAHVPLDRSTRQIAVHPYSLPLENRCSHSSNPHRSQRRHRAPSGPRFRALALLGRLSWERVDGFVMQTSEKPAHKPAVPAKGGERPGWAENGMAACGRSEAALDVQWFWSEGIIRPKAEVRSTAAVRQYRKMTNSSILTISALFTLAYLSTLLPSCGFGDVILLPFALWIICLKRLFSSTASRARGQSY